MLCDASSERRTTVAVRARSEGARSGEKGVEGGRRRGERRVSGAHLLETTRDRGQARVAVECLSPRSLGFVLEESESRGTAAGPGLVAA